MLIIMIFFNNKLKKLDMKLLLIKTIEKYLLKKMENKLSLNVWEEAEYNTTIKERNVLYMVTAKVLGKLITNMQNN
jgi:hypothetical protein